MIYGLFKGLLLALLKAPALPPEPPAGSPGSVQVFRASKNFLMYKLILLGVGTILPILGTGIGAAAMILDPKSPPGAQIVMIAACGFVMLVGLFSYFAIRLEYDMRYYIVTDRSLRIREGIWTIREVTLTYANVQHLELHQGPIQQMLGIADLFVRTAGGAGPIRPEQAALAKGHEGAFRGIDNASDVRDQINALLKKYRDAGLGDPEDRRRTAAPARPGFSPLAVERLREIRDELRALRQRP